jgi:hypothetical protein
MADFRNQRFSSQLSPIRQEPDHALSPNVSPGGSSSSSAANAYYQNARPYGTEPDLLSRNIMNTGQFRSANNLNQTSALLQPSAGPLAPIYNQTNTSYANKELVKQLRGNIELLFKGTK